jgi:hypothetical protein
VTTGIGLKLTYIPPGSFTMGAEPSEPGAKPAEKPHKVTISKGFYMGIHEVTQDQYLRVMGKNPSVFQGEMLLKNKKIVETMEPGVVGNNRDRQGIREQRGHSFPNKRDRKNCRGTYFTGRAIQWLNRNQTKVQRLAKSAKLVQGLS